MVNERDLKPISKQFKEPFYKTYEQFILEGRQDQKVADNYQAEFDAYGNISSPKGYGPSPEQYYSDSSGNYVRVTVISGDSPAERDRKARAWETGYSEGILFIECMSKGINPFKDGETCWQAHTFDIYANYTKEVDEGRSAGRVYWQKHLEASRRGRDSPIEPKNPYKD